MESVRELINLALALESAENNIRHFSALMKYNDKANKYHAIALESKTEIINKIKALANNL